MTTAKDFTITKIKLEARDPFILDKFTMSDRNGNLILDSNGEARIFNGIEIGEELPLKGPNSPDLLAEIEENLQEEIMAELNKSRKKL